MRGSASDFHRYCFYIAGIIGVVFRIILCANPALTIDEHFTMGLITIPFAQFLIQVPMDVHPPLYYCILYLWAQINPSVIFLKISSLLISIAEIFVIYYFLKDLTKNMQIAYIGTTLTLINPNVIFLCSLLRMYGLFLLLSTFSFWMFARLLEQWWKPVPLRTQPVPLSFWQKNHNECLWIIVNVLNCYTHYFAILLVGIEIVLWLIVIMIFRPKPVTIPIYQIQKTRQKGTWIWILFFCIPIGCIIPYFFVPGHPLGSLLSYFSFSPSQSFVDFLNTSLNFLSALWPYDNLMQAIRIIVVMIFLGFILYAIWLVFRTQAHNEIELQPNFLIRFGKTVLYWGGFFLAILLMIGYFFIAGGYAIDHFTRYFIFMHLLALPLISFGCYQLIYKKETTAHGKWKKNWPIVLLLAIYIDLILLCGMFYLTYYPTGLILSN